jgi:putative ABC transport system permease protein
MFSDEMKQHKAMGGIFPVTFLLIALLTILTTMTRMVNNQRIQIGTLKALGFKRFKIILHYVSYGFLLSLLGSILGAVIGPKTLPYLFYDSLKTAYTLPKFEPRLLPKVWIMVAIMVILCTLINYLACRSILKETPSESLRPKVIHAKNRNRLEKSKLWRKMGFSLQWNIRDIFRSKIRSIMAVVGITGCMGLLVCSFGMWEDLKDLTIWLYEDINQYKSIIHIAEETTSEQIDSILKDVNGETIMESAIEIKSKDKKKTGQLLVTDQVTLIKFTDVNRKNINIPQDGIMITSKMADSLGVKIGDKIKWHIYGDQKWVTTKIGAINRNPASQGITVSREEYEKLEFQYIPTSIVTDKEVFGQMKGASSIQTIEKEKESYHTITEAMSVLTYVLVVAAIVLVIVVLYNLGVLSYTEKEKELATLKVLGFKTGKVRSLLLTQNILLSFVGIIPGIWFGKILVDVMFHYTGDSMDMMNIISFKNIFISIIITLCMSIMTNLLFSKKLKKIDMVSALKGIE